ncbi:MAG: N-6 DNA methylase [Candidatus Pacebacteria bacterium]|nr:N-6 DNA methylase [Candidatus Paceibacterota bacterium]
MNGEIKKHIDAARQVLVGVVPNPSSQIDQITYALIYKFMDDMDQAAIKNGDKSSFFIDDLKDYSWARLMDSKLGNQEKMNLYVSAFQKFSEAKQLPELFRNILKSAFLPYRSPETLGLFLKEINYFDYSHPEELGNAYEYLLSIMSSQGDAGQFRTPRHIIDFIVNVVNPTKDDKILDPACGTGGFLISSYKHILEQHDGKDDPEGKEKPLTPDERRKLMSNLEGYDIDPGMVRIAQVNMYLHQFKDPKIFQYDTLSSEERWKDHFDVILANPPFMSPKGGITPHKKFSVSSNRSEVLFVDYIMNHLRPKGRAGIIVPEGIIFQSGKAYKELRKNLVNDGLCAVVSLPSGVFNPYSGVKTSILFFDNEIAKETKEILFVKINQDGFNLGAQRKPIEKNDLPEALEVLKKWKSGEKVESNLALYVEKSKIAENDDYNLSGDRYRVAIDYITKWPMVELGEMCDIYQPKTITSNQIKDIGKYKVFGANGVIGYFDKYNHEDAEVAMTCRGATCGTINFTEPKSWITGNAMIIKPKGNDLNKTFLFYLLGGTDLSSVISGAAQPQITQTSLKSFKIPLPPLEIQEEIIKELDGYQNIITGAKQIIDNWRPKIDIKEGWKKIKVAELVKDKIIEKPLDGNHGEIHPKSSDYVQNGVPFIMANDLFDGEVDIESSKKITKKQSEGLRTGFAKNGDVLLTHKGTIGRTAILNSDYDYVVLTPQVTYYRILDNNIILNKYLKAYFDCDFFQDRLKQIAEIGATRAYIGITDQLDLEIVLPSLDDQKIIIDQIEKEYLLVKSVRELIYIHEQKIRKVTDKLWNKYDN